MKNTPSPQIENLLAKVKESVESGNYIIRAHALIRLNEREISVKDTLYVLAHGYHEKQKTSYDLAYKTWKYAIRGKTGDGLDIRVIIAFVEKMAIITVIRLKKRRT